MMNNILKMVQNEEHLLKDADFTESDLLKDKISQRIDAINNLISNF